jgi:hypothetical protein
VETAGPSLIGSSDVQRWLQLPIGRETPLAFEIFVVKERVQIRHEIFDVLTLRVAQGFLGEVHNAALGSNFHRNGLDSGTDETEFGLHGVEDPDVLEVLMLRR